MNLNIIKNMKNLLPHIIYYTHFEDIANSRESCGLYNSNRYSSYIKQLNI